MRRFWAVLWRLCIQLKGFGKWLRRLHGLVLLRSDFEAALQVLAERAGESSASGSGGPSPFLNGWFAVGGLCSSNYPSSFNAAAKRTYRLLQGACRAQKEIAAWTENSSLGQAQTSSAAETALRSSLSRLLPREEVHRARVLCSLGEFDDTQDTHAQARQWTCEELLPALHKALLEARRKTPRDESSTPSSTSPEGRATAAADGRQEVESTRAETSSSTWTRVQLLLRRCEAFPLATSQTLSSPQGPSPRRRRRTAFVCWDFQTTRLCLRFQSKATYNPPPRGPRRRSEKSPLKNRHRRLPSFFSVPFQRRWYPTSRF